MIPLKVMISGRETNVSRPDFFVRLCLLKPASEKIVQDV